MNGRPKDVLFALTLGRLWQLHDMSRDEFANALDKIISDEVQFNVKADGAKTLKYNGF